MSQLNYKVNPKELEESYDALPAGEYLAVIEKSDYVSTKAGTGMILRLTYQIIDGPLKGRKLFENLNLENPSTQAQQIAIRTLNSIGVATGVMEIEDSSLLHNIPMKINVKVKDDAVYGKGNLIKDHLPAKDTAVAATPATAQAQSAPAAAEELVQPWNKP